MGLLSPVERTSMDLVYGWNQDGDRFVIMVKDPGSEEYSILERVSIPESEFGNIIWWRSLTSTLERFTQATITNR